jgi:hypothetical protein
VVVQEERKRRALAEEVLSLLDLLVQKYKWLTQKKLQRVYVLEAELLLLYQYKSTNTDTPALLVQKYKYWNTDTPKYWLPSHRVYVLEAELFLLYQYKSTNTDTPALLVQKYKYWHA